VEGSSELRDLALDTRQYLGIDMPRDDAIRLQLAEL
jgi:hypothetical protein